MYIKKDRITIRKATIDDSALLASWWNDGRIMAHAGYPLGLGISTEEVTLELTKESESTHQRLIIELDALAIGEMKYYNRGDKVAEIGIKICDFSKLDLGYGSQALKLLLTTLFTEYGYELIKLDTSSDNFRAQHLYEKLGFIKTKTRYLGKVKVIDYELKKTIT